MNDRRRSVGAALGLTPAKPKGRNLQVAKAASAAEAAANRLDGLNAEEQQKRKERQARKKGKSKKRTSYQPSSRESMQLFSMTTDVVMGESEDEGKAEEMPPLDGTDESAGDGHESDKASSVIVTPGLQLAAMLLLLP